MARIFTIGHSTHSFEEFIGLLRAHGIELVADVRSIPRSRRNPQFEQDALRKALRARRIGYRWMKSLGGRRHARKDSPNTGWRNSSFRGYADYMATAEFAQALDKLENFASKKRIAIMCAEAVPWRCHRSLIADALTKRKRLVRHITSKREAKRHKLTPFLKVRQGTLLYV